MENKQRFSPAQQQEIARFQQTQQSLEMFMQQKMSTEAEIREISFALNELENSNADTIVYQSVGGLLVKKTQPELLTYSKDKKEKLEMRLKSLEVQENRLKQQLEEQRTKLQSFVK